jgi:DNA-directed RNA polymerase alpha subunit
VVFPSIRSDFALAPKVAAGLKTVGNVRRTSDTALLNIQNLGKKSVRHLN